MALEVIAHAKVRDGQAEGFEARVAEILRVTREQDEHTLRCDWFISDDGKEYEVHEMFRDEHGLIEHQMHIMQARTILFRDHAFDHRSSIYGEVSQDFIDLVEQRMGTAPATFSLAQGLERSAPATAPGAAGHLELHAHLKVRPGQLEGCKAQAAEIVQLTREQDTHTLRYDWFINREGTECEVHEAYVSDEGLIEHNAHVMGARAVLFEKYAYDHRMSVYGEISPELRGLFDKHAGGVSCYSFVQGLGSAADVPVSIEAAGLRVT
jgi:quinol monooxygenase YgiN